MIAGRKPSGYFETHRGDGIKVEGHTHCCAHCQFTWEYRPGSGTRRGFCLKCHSLVCGRPECEAEQQRMLAMFPEQTRSCMPYSDFVERQRDHYDADPRFEVLPSGIVVARG